MKILLVEDNNDLALNIAEFFEGRGHVIDYSADGLTALNLMANQLFDVIVLDIMLPGLNGISVCQHLRENGNGHTPVIMLTAKDTEQDKLAGFSAGADDYLVKPFSLPELEARLLALVRRSKAQVSVNKMLVVDELEYNPATMRLKRNGKDLFLKPVPLKILLLLMQNCCRVVTRAEIEEAIWGDHVPDSEVLRSHIYAIRNEINQYGSTNIIRTVRGVGYILDVAD